ncbi:histone-lysine N-methyltransferase SETMAR-like [Arctopsyche grandis]|uniref:histone-lysine N-methyltransferase SETMAR-like n=1 Tax=Arctopsyche grandis TaxID=121162 RepID=UPI00406D8ED4
MENEKIHLRHVMLYEFRKGVSVGTAQKNIQEVYLDHAPALRTVKKWFCKFRNGDFNMEDQPRSGRPSVIDDDIVSDLVKNNPRITTKEIAEKMNVNNSSAFRRLKKLGFTFEQSRTVDMNKVCNVRGRPSSDRGRDADAGGSRDGED